MAKATTRRTLVPEEMRGVVHITGQRGIGKSFFLAQMDFPDNILFIDYENKGESLDSQVKFGAYHAVTRGENTTPLDVYTKTMEIINSIEQDRYTIAILDNVSWLELALRAEANRNVERYVMDYNLNLKNVKSGRFGGLSSVVNFLISDKICNALHSKGVGVIAITSHVKPAWGASGIIPNKMRVKGADRWQELSVLSIILVPGDNPPIPSGLVMKEQLGSISIIDPNKLSDKDYEMYQRGELGHNVTRRLPLRLPEATPQAIRYYLKHPANISEPEKGEVPGPEKDIYSDKLSAEQLDYMRKALDFATREDAAEDEAFALAQELERKEFSESTKLLVTALYEKGVVALPDIATALREEGHIVPVPLIAEALSEIKKGASND